MWATRLETSFSLIPAPPDSTCRLIALGANNHPSVDSHLESAPARRTRRVLGGHRSPLPATDSSKVR